MRRFKFKLQKILKLREDRERETELELGKAVGALSALELKIRKVAEEKVKAAGNRFNTANNLNQMQSYDFYILRLDQTKDLLLEAAAKAEFVVEEARKVYLEASRDRKIIDKLRERREKEYRHTMKLEEIAVIDDISSGTAARKMIGA
ncbi:flagellar protein FliJ [Spirochaetia bacterium]|nr:flagellar protein FliJ [Spirochaetia bacterium]